MVQEHSHPIDVDLLRTLIACDPETGALTWLPRPREMFAKENSWRAFQSSVATMLHEWCLHQAIARPADHEWHPEECAPEWLLFRETNKTAAQKDAA
jgi:hypothetical protein